MDQHPTGPEAVAGARGGPRKPRRRRIFQGTWTKVGGWAADPLRGVVIMAIVATTSVTETAPVPRSPASRPNLVSVGTIVWLSSEMMFFAALFAMYFTIRSVDKGSGLPWPGAHLDIALGSVNTTVLLLSSVTCQMGVFAVERGQIKRTRSLLHPMSGGLIAFIFLLGRTYAAKRFTHEQQVSAIVVSYYWHFVDVVWIGLFTTIYLIH